MSKKYSRGLFIFRRDLRIQDNIGLMAALKECDEVTPVFIFDPRQIGDNDYRSEFAIQFMVTSLEELAADIESRSGRMNFLNGEAESVVDELLSTADFQALYLNADYTPFSRHRDSVIKEICEKRGVAYHASHDALLDSPGTVLKGDGSPYTVYTPYMKRASQRVPEESRVNRFRNFCAKPLPKQWSDFRPALVQDPNELLFRKGGRLEAVKILKSLARYEEYEEQRNFPALPGTTGLSAHLKFGTVSVREVYHSVAQVLGSGHGLIRELYWRDFFTHIAWFFPQVFGASFQSKFAGVKWRKNKKAFEKWCLGMTGFPIVDAGMRELNATGYMHNRVRMVVASFLTKDLHLDWRLGEKYFAQKLIDYDPSVNNGNWQWGASTGCDAQPYFRIFNPWSQQKKFDLECEYIQKWVPELSELSPKEIHKLEETDQGYRPASYPSPIVDHAIARVEAREMFEDAKDSATR